MDFFFSIIGFFASGGLFMFPILVVFAVGVRDCSRTLTSRSQR